MKILFIFIFTACITLYPQQSGEPVTITGDSLVGKILNGESVREVYGNVVIRQRDIVITCDKAVQYLLKNNAVLEGNVVITQDTLIIKAPKGYYYGDEQIAEGNNGVELNDRSIILTAVNGTYYFDEDRAFFSDSVKLYDTVSTLTSNQLTYFKNEQKVIAVGEVAIEDSINLIKADSLVHFREEKITYAENNVLVYNAGNNTTIYGNHLEDYGKKKYTIITDQPLLIQIDSTGNGIVDSLIIASITMESYNDSTQTFIATDSVRIIQSGLASRNDKTIYYRNEDKIITYMPQAINEVDSSNPVLWYENTQFSGDSINIYIKDNELNKIEIIENAFILSQDSNYNNRYDQISGDTVVVFFDSTGIDYANVEGNVLSIHYMFEGEDTNGLSKASSQRAEIHFKDDEVNEIRLYIQPMSEFHPENLVRGNELSFTLPSFKIYKDRPQKEELFMINNSRLDNLKLNTTHDKTENLRENNR